MLELPDRTVQIERAGDGPPVVYLHSALGEGYWNDFTEALAGHGYDVVVPAHPGYWDSTQAEWIKTARDLALHYVDVLDALGLENALVVGSSLGGWVATELAILRPGRVRGLALVAPLGLWAGHEPPDIFALQPYESAAVLFADPDHDMARLLASIDLDNPPSEELILPLLQTFEAGARYAWRTDDPTLEPRLRFASVVPSLVLWGTADAFADARLADVYRESMGSALGRLEGAGHMAALERPAEAADLIDRFFRSAPP
jgi:pimeloyl-ACP methyl ester carboxylesterase